MKLMTFFTCGKDCAGMQPRFNYSIVCVCLKCVQNVFVVVGQ